MAEFAPHGMLAILAGVATVIFSFVGAEIVTIAAAEARESARIIARLTSTVAVRILLFFVVSIFLIVCIVPWDTIKPGTSPFAVALEHVGIPGAAAIMKLVVLTAVLSCLNSGIYVTSRVLFGLAAKGEAPQWLVAVTASRVPRRAILAGAAFGFLAMAVSAVAPQRVFSFLVNSSGAIALVNYWLVALAELRLRAMWERDAPARAGDPHVAVSVFKLGGGRRDRAGAGGNGGDARFAQPVHEQCRGRGLRAGRILCARAPHQIPNCCRRGLKERQGLLF